MSQRFAAVLFAVAAAAACGGMPPVPQCETSKDCASTETCVDQVCVPKECKPTPELCNGVDDDCDGRVDEGVCIDAGEPEVDGGVPEIDGGVPEIDGGVPEIDGGVPEIDGGVPEVDGGVPEVDGGVVDAGPTCTPATEVCDGIDNDCDGQIDEGVTVACVNDSDGDRYATSSVTTQLCADPSRPAAGNCPAGTIAPSVSLGIDCNPMSASAWTLAAARADADNDTACTGAVSQLCIGSALPPGRRSPSACAAVDDCDDADASRWALSELIVDADNDRYCSGGPTVMRCVGTTAPAGTRFAFDCLSQSDCNDANPNVYRLLAARPDGDNDGFCFGPTTNQCSGSTLPAGFRAPSTCNAVDDCRDTNPLAGAQCVLPAAYTTTSAVKTCVFVPATESFTVSATNICPLGFMLGSYVANKTAGTGSCTATSSLTLSMTCNGLDGATCSIVGSCLAL